jgi:hypothetical protein
VVYGGTWIHIFGDSLELTVVFKCSMETGGVWGNMDIYFWGLLGVDGCIQVFDGDRWCMGEHGYIFLGTPWVDGCIQMFGGVRT